MYLRKRQTNLSIEKAVYEPAVRDAQGAVVKQAIRTTAYIGSIGVHTRYADVPSRILERLSDMERTELRDALKTNEPNPYLWLDGLPRYIDWAILEMSEHSKKIDSPEERKVMELRVKNISAAWESFFKTAQDCGLKRKSKKVVRAK